MYALFFVLDQWTLAFLPMQKVMAQGILTRPWLIQHFEMDCKLKVSFKVFRSSVYSVQYILCRNFPGYIFIFPSGHTVLQSIYYFFLYRITTPIHSTSSAISGWWWSPWSNVDPNEWRCSERYAIFGVYEIFNSTYQYVLKIE